MSGIIAMGNTSENTGDGYYNWTFYLRGATHLVEHVTCTLHPTFPDPVRKLTGPVFEFHSRGYAGFRMGVQIQWKGGHVIEKTWNVQVKKADANVQIVVPAEVAAACAGGSGDGSAGVGEAGDGGGGGAGRLRRLRARGHDGRGLTHDELLALLASGGDPDRIVASLIRRRHGGRGDGSDPDVGLDAADASSGPADDGDTVRHGAAFCPDFDVDGDPDVIEKILSTFMAFDVDGDGLLGMDEISSLLKMLDPGRWNDALLQNFLVAADMNGDGMIQYEEFVRWIMDTPVREDAFEASHKGDFFEASDAKVFTLAAGEYEGGPNWRPIGILDAGAAKHDRLRLYCRWKHGGPDPQEARIRVVLRRGGNVIQMDDCFGICAERRHFRSVERIFTISDSLVSLQQPGDEFVFEYRVGGDGEHRLAVRNFLAMLSRRTCPPGVEACKWGGFCYNKDPAHRKTMWHPRTASAPSKEPAIRACKYGTTCYMKNPAHLEAFAHPGDRKYRHGLVVFPPGKGPEFQTLWDLFSFFDLDETGHVTKEEFEGILLQCQRRGGNFVQNLDEAWSWAGGEADGYLNFARVAAWAERSCVALPVGLDASGDRAPCHFRRGTHLCSCVEYKPDDGGFVCVCGHKPSMHRTDVASLLPSELEDAGRSHWKDAAEGLVQIEQKSRLFRSLQELLDRTHKKEDNWTRDRGCTFHGRDGPGCSPACMVMNRAPVPTGYKLRRVFRNQNKHLLQNYLVMRNAIVQECSSPSSAEFSDVNILSQADLDTCLVAGCNEWRLFHGSNRKACNGICNTNFKLSLSGSGATWKEPGSDVGSPLYGYGIYLAERITKADEYSEPIGPGRGSGLFSALVVRCVGGRANVVTSNEIDKDKLRKDVFDGPYHSVFGDRVSSLGKPYREVVVYDKDQIFPEFLLFYERCYDEG